MNDYSYSWKKKSGIKVDDDIDVHTFSLQLL